MDPFPYGPRAEFPAPSSAGADDEEVPSPTGPRRTRSRETTLVGASGGTRQGSAAAPRPRAKRGPSPTSCAECRRLKLKCDGKVPCGQCAKRGYMAICPDGSQTTGQGHRLFWSTTSELRVKLSQYADRVHALEAALGTAHALVDNAPHHLLSEDQLRIVDARPAAVHASPAAATLPRPTAAPSGPEGDGMWRFEDEEAKPDVSGVMDRFGSLAISQSGESQFFGHAAYSLWFMQNEDPTEHDATDPALWDLLPLEILAQAGSFPLALVLPPHVQSPGEHLRMLYELLPAEDEALRLRDCAFRYGFFLFRPILPEQYMAKIHEPVYGDTPRMTGAGGGADDTEAVRLSVLFTLLAVGALFSPDLPPRSAQAQRLYHLGRAALMRAHVLDSPTIEGIQAVYLQSLYTCLLDTAAVDTSHRCWAMCGLMMKLAFTMGLQCDPDRFNLQLEEAKRRRALFCDLLLYDMGLALMFSRPVAISSGYYDVRVPIDEAAGRTPESDFHVWKHKWTTECLGPVHAQACGARPPSYSTVLALSRTIEAFPLWDPPSTDQGHDHPNYEARLIQRHLPRVTAQEMLLLLHRPFFALATSRDRADPLASEYGGSVIAAYRSAHAIVSFLRYLTNHVRHPIDRVWFIWSNLFSAAVALGSLVIRCPHISFARDAYEQLQVACDLFARIAPAFGAEKVHDRMLAARDQARESLTEYIAGRPRAGPGPAGPGQNDEDDADLLSKFGATTRTIARPGRPSGGSPAALSPIASDGSRSTPRSSPGRAEPVIPLPLAPPAAGYHPRVLEYLRELPPNVEVLSFEAIPAPPPAPPHPIHPRMRMIVEEVPAPATPPPPPPSVIAATPVYANQAAPPTHARIQAFGGAYGTLIGEHAAQAELAPGAWAHAPASSYGAPAPSPDYSPFALDYLPAGGAHTPVHDPLYGAAPLHPAAAPAYAYPSGTGEYIPFAPHDTEGAAVYPAMSAGSGPSTSSHPAQIVGQPPRGADWAAYLAQMEPQQ